MSTQYTIAQNKMGGNEESKKQHEIVQHGREEEASLTYSMHEIREYAARIQQKRRFELAIKQSEKHFCQVFDEQQLQPT